MWNSLHLNRSTCTTKSYRYIYNLGKEYKARPIGPSVMKESAMGRLTLVRMDGSYRVGWCSNIGVNFLNMSTVNEFVKTQQATSSHYYSYLYIKHP